MFQKIMMNMELLECPYLDLCRENLWAWIRALDSKSEGGVIHPLAQDVISGG
jgi:hypothetical protein